MKPTETKICPICDTYHNRYGKTCSSECAHKSTSMSRRAQEAKKRGELEWKPGPRYDQNLAYWTNNPEKRAAYIKVAGMRLKANHASCSKCGATDTRIEMHHWSYENPALVEPLCTTCHALADRIRKWALNVAVLSETEILAKAWKLAPAFKAHTELLTRMTTTDKLSRNLERAKKQEAKKLETFNNRIARI